MVDRLHVIIRGRVQGVGFRYSAYRQAEALGLNGWVRNRADGSVEALFEGSKSRLDEMLAWCREGSRYALVSTVDADWSSGDPQYTDFQIVG